MPIDGLHHAAYRCRDAQETVDFYTRLLGLPHVMAISVDRFPSTGGKRVELCRITGAKSRFRSPEGSGAGDTCGLE